MDQVFGANFRPGPACPIARSGRFFYSPGVTVPDATGSSPAAIDPQDALPRAGRVVRRVLLRRNIVIDAETAQLVAAAVQAALQADAPGARVDT